ncbi:hypothetical protein, partial [Paenibacillus wynnii]|uniref:hypothetical protein n=1 Tax=Paenibacillus wynnii TaxID=268407 RepID=UPI0035936F2E
EAQTSLSPWNFLRKMRYYFTSDWDSFIQVLNMEPTRRSKGRQKIPKPAEAPPRMSAKRETVKIIVG